MDVYLCFVLDSILLSSATACRTKLASLAVSRLRWQLGRRHLRWVPEEGHANGAPDVPSAKLSHALAIFWKVHASLCTLLFVRSDTCNERSRHVMCHVYK